MDLSRGRLESFGETFPIVEGWITSVHPDRRKLQLQTLPFPDRRRLNKKKDNRAATPSALWVAAGHFTVRATENSESFSFDGQKLFLVVQGIRFEVAYIKPVYVDSRNHKFIYAASKTQRWSFVALFTPTGSQLRMLPVADENKPGQQKPKTVLGRVPTEPGQVVKPAPAPSTPNPSQPATVAPNLAAPLSSEGPRKGLSYVAKVSEDEEAKDIAAFLQSLLEREG